MPCEVCGRPSILDEMARRLQPRGQRQPAHTPDVPIAGVRPMSSSSVARPGWDDYFLNITVAVAARADCRRSKHGAVIVLDHRIVATGYNGSEPGGLSCLAGQCPRGLLDRDECPSGGSYENCIALHAEQNAIAYADHIDTDGATIYITGAPCDMCTKLIKAAGIIRVVHR